MKFKSEMSIMSIKNSVDETELRGMCEIKERLEEKVKHKLQTDKRYGK